MQLSSWIDPRHLEEPAIAAMAEGFTSSPHRTLVIDDFLSRPRLDALRRLFSTEGEFSEQFYRLGDARKKYHVPIGREEFLSLPAERRSSVEAMYVGPRPEYRMGEGVLTHLKLQQMLAAAPFRHLLERIVGYEPGALLFMPPRIFAHGHFVAPHSDAGTGKRLCAVLYLNDGWRPDYGGEFRQTAPPHPPMKVAPLANRLLLFRPSAERRHEVLPLTDTGRHWRRWAYSFWFGSHTGSGAQLDGEATAGKEGV